jgi:hypothetical protein
MKKRFFKVLVVLAVCTAAAVLFSCSKKEPVLTVTNNTGYTAYYLYISKESTDDWEEDVLGDEVVLDGDSVNVTLPSSGNWDVMLKDEYGDTYSKYKIKVTKDMAIVISSADQD